MDKRRLNALINSYSYLDPEYGPRLTNHLPMALYALHKIGASDDRIKSFAESHIKARGLKPLKQKVDLHFNEQTYKNHLGTHDYYHAHKDYFSKQLKTYGREETLKKHINFLMHGVCGAAFHGLLRTAFGLRSDNDQEIISGLAYWADTHKTILDDSLALKDNGQSLHACFEEAHQAYLKGHWDHVPHSAPNIYSKIKYIADTPAFGAMINSLSLDKATSLDDFREVSLALYQTQPNFTSLHCLTGVHGFKEIYNHAADKEQAKAIMAQSIIAAYISLGAPKLTPQHISKGIDDSELRKAWDIIQQSSNDHAIKLAFSAQEEYEQTGNPAYQHIIYDIAAPKL